MLTEKEALDPMTEFYDAIGSPTTRRKYELRLRQFLSWVYGAENGFLPTGRQGMQIDQKAEREIQEATRGLASKFVSRSKKEPEWATSTVDSFLREVKDRVEAGEIAASTVSIYMKPLKLFCTMNDVPINWAKLSKKMPKGRHAADDRPPSLEEVRKILQYPDRRIKPVVLVMLSSGIRVGSWDFMQWGNFEKVERNDKLVAAKLRAYNTKSKRWYNTFVTPEAYAAVAEYMQYRGTQGEKITPASPVIRDLLYNDKGGSGGPTRPLPMNSRVVKKFVTAAIVSAGLREKLPAGIRRHPFKATHGFRKFFDTTCERSMKSLHVEMLEDHDTGLKESYNRPTEDDMLNDYLRAVPELTVTDEWKLVYESEVNAREREGSTKGLVASLTKQNNELQEQVKILADRLGKTESRQAEVSEKQRKSDEIMNKLFQNPEFKRSVREALQRKAASAKK